MKPKITNRLASNQKGAEHEAAIRRMQLSRTFFLTATWIPKSNASPLVLPD
jgi:hypothetical protein